MKKLIIFVAIIITSMHCRAGLDSLKWDKSVSPHTLYAEITLGFGNQIKQIDQYFINGSDTLLIDLIFTDCSAPTGGYKWDSLSNIPSSILQPTYCILVRLIFDSNSIPGNCYIHDRFIDTLFMDCNAPLSIVEIGAAKNGLEIYPNPVKDKLLIQTIDEIEFCSIYNQFGVLIKKEKYKNEIDVSLLAGGVYYLEVKTVKGLLRRKFVKI